MAVIPAHRILNIDCARVHAGDGHLVQVLDGNANVVLIANNSGTSLNSINNFYAKYLRGTDDKMR